jgi:hypothetical protein
MTRNAHEVVRRRRICLVSLVTSRLKGDPDFFVFSLPQEKNRSIVRSEFGLN